MNESSEFAAVTEALEAAPPSLTPVDGREAPAIWVERMAIYRSWPPSNDTRLRQVELRRGLNIIWAHPVGKNPAASRLAGHSAGKSTFCRLLRYVLDDTTAGTADFRKRFELTFGIGWALAEVHVGGRRWLVGRPIAENAVGYHSFAYPDGRLTQEFPERPPRIGYRDYCAAIDEAVFGEMAIRLLPGSQKNLDWPQLVQWLSRDQEAHFRGLLEWRETDSDSESIPISADDRASLVRLVLGLVQQKEQPLLKDFAEKSAAHESKVRERVKLEFAIERDRAALAEAINLPVGDPKDSVLQLEISNQVTDLRNQSDAAVKTALQDDANRALLDEVARTQAEYEIARVIADDAKAKLEMEDNRIKGITPPRKAKETVSPIRQMLQSLEPFYGYCSHPMDAAYRAECPIAKQRPPDDAVRKITEDIEGLAPTVRSELERLKTDAEHHEGVAAEKKRAMESAEALFTAARVRQRIELESLKEPARSAAKIEALHYSFAKGCQDLETLNGQIIALGADKEALDGTLKALTKLHKDLLATFTRLFHHVSQHLVDKAVKGRVEFSGKSIEPRLEYNGDRDSAALKVTKWVVFDLAALTLGITTNEAYHPRFLLHDSPRESDMAPIMYAGLFNAAKEIEGSFGEAAPFQYIVTTTEPPPEDMRKEPWMRLELDASVEADRFLGVNL
jgi:hypothetical protein